METARTKVLPGKDAVDAQNVMSNEAPLNSDFGAVLEVTIFVWCCRQVVNSDTLSRMMVQSHARITHADKFNPTNPCRRSLLKHLQTVNRTRHHDSCVVSSSFDEAYLSLTISASKTLPFQKIIHS